MKASYIYLHWKVLHDLNHPLPTNLKIHNQTAFPRSARNSSLALICGHIKRSLADSLHSLVTQNIIKISKKIAHVSGLIYYQRKAFSELEL